MPQWLGISDMLNVSHTPANCELSFSTFRYHGSCMLPKHWKGSSQLSSVCETFDKDERVEDENMR